jgi:hypothetical protein
MNPSLIHSLCLRWPQTWNNFQLHRPFYSIAKRIHVDGEQRHLRDYFSSTRRIK